MEMPAEGAVDLEPCFTEAAKADWLGFYASGDCASCLGTFEEDGAHIYLLSDDLMAVNREPGWLTNSCLALRGGAKTWLTNVRLWHLAK